MKGGRRALGGQVGIATEFWAWKTAATCALNSIFLDSVGIEALYHMRTKTLGGFKQSNSDDRLDRKSHVSLVYLYPGLASFAK